MNPTTASPSQMLLNPAAPLAKSAATADAGSRPDAASSGFGVMLGGAQRLQQKLSESKAENDTASKNSDKSNVDSGNALPLLGPILPLTALPQSVSDAAAKADAAGTTKSKDDKDQDASIAAADLILPVVTAPPAPTGLVIQPPRLGDSSATTVAATGADVTLTAQSRFISAAKAGTAENKTTESIPVDANLVDSTDGTSAIVSSTAANSAKSAANAVAPTDPNSMAAAANAMASMLTGGTNSTDTAVSVKAAGPTTSARSVAAAVGVNADITAVSTDITASATAFVKEVEGASKHLAESDFDALIKHFDAPSSQLTLPPAAIGDSANVHQASRTYADAASSGVSVSVPVGSSGWSDAVTDKVMWFGANKISSAEIHLNPPDLGPLQVRVSTQHDQMSVVFTSQHAAVRDALDQALPRLREMMGNQGLQLLDVSVGGQSAQQQPQHFTRNHSDRGAAPGGFFADDSAAAAVAGVTTVDAVRQMRSGVDAYA